MASSSFSSSANAEGFIQTLTNRGWCFGNTDQIKALISIQLALHGDSCTVDSIESELCNLDLRSIGGKSLPDVSLLRKSSHFPSPKVLQVSSARDIARSSIAEGSGNSNNHRLLRLKLTDGHSDIIAIEYSHIPSILDNIVPGTKVRLENKVVMHSGIVCLNPKVITVIGGVVQSLYEEWEMNQKYSGFSRSSVKLSQNGETGGPPPFEKLQPGALLQQFTKQGRPSQCESLNQPLFNSSRLPPNEYPVSSSKDTGQSCIQKGGSSASIQKNDLHNSDLKVGSSAIDQKPSFNNEKTEGKQPSSEARAKEVAESLPVQNQAAAQKLLQKMNNPNRDNRHSRGWKQRGRGRERDEAPVLTLDEWERKKAGESSSRRQEPPGISQDEDLARRLQNQFDLEDLHVGIQSSGPHMTEADNIRMNMFSFERDDPGGGVHGRTRFRGRGGGGDRGRSRGRGRGRGRI